MNLPTIREEQQGQPAEHHKLDDFRSLLLRSEHVSKWKKARKTGYHSKSLRDDQMFYIDLKDHETAFRSSFPLPLLCIMENNVLHMLKDTEKEYSRILGSKHEKTRQLKANITDLEASLATKSVPFLEEDEDEENQKKGVLAVIQNWVRTKIIAPFYYNFL